METIFEVCKFFFNFAENSGDMKYLLSILFLTCFTAAETMTGIVVKVTDGDTVTVLVAGNRQEIIRLADIDAPEKGQPFSEKSRIFLSDMVAGKTVRVEYSRRDLYGRILGVVFVDGKNVNEELLKAGLAWNYHYSRNKRYAELEAEAKRQRLNIFSERNPVSPYDYRRGKR